MKIKKANPNIFLTILFFFLLSASLHADTVRIGLQIWPGERDPAISKHLFFDDLLNGNGFGRFDVTPWDNTDKFMVFPFTLQYLRPMGGGTFFAGLNIVNYRPEYAFRGFSGNSLSMVSLQNYSAWDGELEAGFEFNIDGKFLIAPKAGLRYHSQYYIYDELTLGGTNQITLNDRANEGGLLSGTPYRSNAQGGFLGANFGYKINPKFSLIGELALSSPILGTIRGNFEGSTVMLGKTPGTTTYSYSFADAEHRIDFLRWMIGAQFDISDNIHILGGLRHETLRESYAGYFNMAFDINATAGTVNPNFNVVEFITDKAFYENPESTEKGLLFFGLTYDFTASGG